MRDIREIFKLAPNTIQGLTPNYNFLDWTSVLNPAGSMLACQWSPILSFANGNTTALDINTSFYHPDPTNPLGWRGFMPLPYWLQTEQLHLNNMWAMYNNKNFRIIPTGKSGDSSFNISSKDVFEQALKTTLGFEGGYSDSKYDKGGKTNYGITHATYDAWRKEHGKPTQSVKNITKEEVRKIYYDYYWVPSGANKISDPKMAIALFDTAVLHGVGGARGFFKQSGGDLKTMKGYDLKKFLQIRQASYDKIVAKDSTQKANYGNWMDRVHRLMKRCGF